MYIKILDTVCSQGMLSHRWLNSTPFWDSGKVWCPKCWVQVQPLLIFSFISLVGSSFSSLWDSPLCSSHSLHLLGSAHPVLLVQWQFLPHTQALLVSSTWDLWPGWLIHMPCSGMKDGTLYFWHVRCVSVSGYHSWLPDHSSLSSAPQ